MTAAKRPIRILVADDDRKFLKIVADALEPQGYEVIQAPNGDLAVQYFDEKKPDLVLVDCLLPLKDGFQVCEEIRNRERGKNLPIVMMTAVYKAADKEREAKTKYKVKDYLTKPVDLRTLLKIIAQVTVT